MADWFDKYAQRHIPSKATLTQMLSGVMRDRTHLIPNLRVLLEDWKNRSVRSREMMDQADTILDGHGVEHLRSVNGRAEAYYVNMGDAYTPTIILDVKKHRVEATDWGSWVEKEERRGNRFD